MPDMPQQGGPAPSPAQGGAQPPQGQGGGGGGIAQVITMIDQGIFKITQAVAQNQQLPDDVKKAWQDALTAVRQAEQLLVKAAGGEGGDEEEEGEGGTTSPEQGGKSGAVPMTHQSMRGQ